ncbi:MAG TPA: SAM-dependent methyltransferase [Steroidobacteraceae bacterium]
MTASGARSMLPTLTPEETTHSARLAGLIGEHITAAGGWLSFEHFMELALYAPGLGYYSAGSHKIGVGGDFVTAPEASDLFSQCLARQCAEVLRGCRHGEILELGAGTGRMAAALLGALAQADALPERYAILEVSADLAARQRERLMQLPVAPRSRVTWLTRLPERPIEGVILANEVADALPCRRFLLAGGTVRELGVARAADGGFGEAHVAADAAYSRLCLELCESWPQPYPQTYTSEVCPRLEPWIGALAASLERGTLLFIDYGLPRAQYYHPQRTHGTLRCHFRQRVHDDPYVNVGVQDISAWVDFTRVAEAAAAANLTVAGFATQAAFLLATGIESLVARAPAGTAQARLAGEARRLLMPGEMGEAFKVMALTRAWDAPLQGFTVQDLRHSL